MPFLSADARRAYFRKRYHDLRSAWLKENGPCRRCGSHDNLTIDHIDPLSKEQADNQTRLWNWSKKRREEGTV